MERARARHGRELLERFVAAIRHDLHPRVALGEDRLDLFERQVALELHREGLAVAAHRAHAYAEAVHYDGAQVVRLWPHEWGPRAPEDLVRLRVPFPLFAALSLAEIGVDPRQQASGERHPEMLGREILVTQDPGDFAVDVADGRCRFGEQALRGERR